MTLYRGKSGTDSGNEEAEDMKNIWVPWIAAAIKNSVAIIAFSLLSVVFERWWIALFAILFMSSVKSTIEKKEGEQDDES